MTDSLAVGFAGSSNTAGTIVPNNYAAQLEGIYPRLYPRYSFSHPDISLGGFATFPNLVAFSGLSSAALIIFDQSLDWSDDTDEVEALFRLAYANGQRIISLVIPIWTVVDNGQINTPYNQTAIEQHLALCTSYGVTVINAWTKAQELVPSTYNLSDLYSDVYHPTELFHTILAGMVDDVNVTGGVITLPGARVYVSSADYENTPINRNGTDNDGTSGAGWSTSGTAIISTTANDTVTFTGTFRKFSIYRASGTNNVTISIDGGTFQLISAATNGYDIGTRAAHTIVVKVVSDCRIDEFWAI